MDVPEAAEKLQSGGARVRRLCATEVLYAQIKGGRWLILADAVTKRSELAGVLRPGRSPAPHTVWKLLATLDGQHRVISSRDRARALRLLEGVGDPLEVSSEWQYLLAVHSAVLPLRVLPDSLVPPARSPW